MFIDLGNRVSLTDLQFQDEMRTRVAGNPGKDVIPGCPLCSVIPKQPPAVRPTQNEGQQH
jgi:hypothetical protein